MIFQDNNLIFVPLKRPTNSWIYSWISNPSITLEFSIFYRYLLLGYQVLFEMKSSTHLWEKSSQTFKTNKLKKKTSTTTNTSTANRRLRLSLLTTITDYVEIFRSKRWWTEEVKTTLSVKKSRQVYLLLNKGGKVCSAKSNTARTDRPCR